MNPALIRGMMTALTALRITQAATSLYQYNRPAAKRLWRRIKPRKRRAATGDNITLTVCYRDGEGLTWALEVVLANKLGYDILDIRKALDWYTDDGDPRLVPMLAGLPNLSPYGVAEQKPSPLDHPFHWVEKIGRSDIEPTINIDINEVLCRVNASHHGCATHS